MHLATVVLEVAGRARRAGEQAGTLATELHTYRDQRKRVKIIFLVTEVSFNET